MSKSKRDIPVFSRPIIETHCHLDYLKEITLDDLTQRCEPLGIERIITIAVSPDNQSTVRDLVSQHDMVYGTQGVHPHDAEKYRDETEQSIRTHINDEKIVAVGEIGLDYYYDHACRKTQREVFEKQLQIAVDYNKPVVIHTREADDDMRSILTNFSGLMKKKGVIHSFTASLQLAQFCLDEGFCLGFNGICTFPKAENVREVIAIAPLEQILLETDSPYLTPVPYRGKENSPLYLPFVAETVAAVQKIDVNVLLAQVYKNSMQTFFSK